MSHPLRTAAAPFAAAGLAALLAGCSMAPTYGTGTPADVQLVNDLSGALSLKPNEKKAGIDYKPRPELVKPASAVVLPEPQESAVAGNPAWPESPEERRKRYRDIATANQDDASFEPLVDAQAPPATPGIKVRRARDLYVEETAAPGPNQRAEFNRRLAQTKQGSAEKRAYLSEPPLDYRAPAETAPVGDVGEDELKKERRQKKLAQGGRSWRDMLPWL